MIILASALWRKTCIMFSTMYKSGKSWVFLALISESYQVPARVGWVCNCDLFFQECSAAEDRVVEAIKVSRVGTSAQGAPKEREIWYESRTFPHLKTDSSHFLRKLCPGGSRRTILMQIGISFHVNKNCIRTQFYVQIDLNTKLDPHRAKLLFKYMIS